MPLPIVTALFIILAALDLLASSLGFAHALSIHTLHRSSLIYFYLVGVLTWVAASRAWIRHPNSNTIRISYLLSLGLLNVCSGGASYQLSEAGWHAYLMPTFQFATSAFLPAAFLHYCLIGPAPIPRANYLVRRLIYLPAPLLFGLWLHGYLTGKTYQQSFFLVLMSPYEVLGLLYFGLYSVTAQVCLQYNFFQAPTRPQRRQSKWLLIGVSGGLMPVTLLVSLPTLLGIPPWFGEVPAYTLILIPICYFVAIIRHRLMDLELMLNRSAVYAIVSSLAIATYLLAIPVLSRSFRFLLGTSDIVFEGLSALLVAVLFAPLKTRVQDWIDRGFYREQYNYRQTLTHLSRTLSSILSLRELADTLLTEVTAAMHLRSGALLVRRSTGLRVEASHNPDGIKIDLLDEDPWLHHIEFLQAPVRTRALPRETPSPQMTELHDTLQADVWVPFLLQDQLVGVLVLGSKLSDEPYTHEDLTLLGTLMHQGGVAIQNALLYEQLRLRTQALEHARLQLVQTYVDTYGGRLPESRRDNVVADFRAIAEALKQSYERLKELDAVKTQFVSNVSHELGTPLTHIKGFVDNLLQGIGGPLTERQQRYLHRISDNCDRLIRLINDLLDLSRIEAGRVMLHLNRVCVPALVDEAVTSVREMAAEQQAELRCTHRIPDLHLEADADKLKQILLNLLVNALKFTDAGGKVTVLTERLPSQEVAIHVEDTGIGISPEDQQRIFERFHQVPGTKARGGHGTGLGLSIVQSLVELHGGRIEVESTPGVGSRFSVLLPERKDACRMKAS